MVIHRTFRQVPARRGFTLMEVLVVSAILVIMAGVGGVMLFRYLDESRESAAKLGIANIETAVGAYKINRGDYPQSLQELLQPEDGKPAYLEERHLLDPWDRPYIYEPGNRHPLTGKPIIYSEGLNPGDPNSRIANWTVR